MHFLVLYTCMKVQNLSIKVQNIDIIKYIIWRNNITLIIGRCIQIKIIRLFYFIRIYERWVKLVKVNNEMLKYCVARSGYNGSSIAKELGLSVSTWRSKSSGSSQFTIKEVRELQQVLALSDSEVIEIFIKGIEV